MSKALYLIAMDLERFQVKGFFEIPLSTLSGDMCSVMFHLFFFFGGGVGSTSMKQKTHSETLPSQTSKVFVLKKYPTDWDFWTMFDV